MAENEGVVKQLTIVGDASIDRFGNIGLIYWHNPEDVCFTDVGNMDQSIHQSWNGKNRGA